MKKALLFAVAGGIILSGCVRTGRMARIDPASVTTRSSLQKSASADNGACALTSQYKGDKAQTIDLDCYRFSVEVDGNGKKVNNKTAYRLATDKNESEEGRKEARNRLQSVLINQANFACQLEKGRLYANRATLDTAFDFISAGFSAASTIVAGDLAKSILSGVAGLSTATRSNINANIYQNQIIPAITLVMDSARREMLIDLRARSRQSVEDYTADEMILLANDYHQACSFERGVQLLLNAALNKEGADAIVRGINLRASAEALRGQIREQVALKKAFDKSNIATDSVTDNIEALQEKLKEISLKISENSQSLDPVSTVDKDKGSEN